MSLLPCLLAYTGLLAPHTPLWLAGGSLGVGPCPSQLGIFLRAFQKYDSHIWITAAVEEGPLGAINLDVEGGAGAWAAAGGARRHIQTKQMGP